MMRQIQRLKMSESQCGDRDGENLSVNDKTETKTEKKSETQLQD